MDQVMSNPRVFDPEVDDLEIALVLLALKGRWGYDFSGYAPSALRRRLLQICSAHGFAHIADLATPILHDEKMAKKIIDGISVPASDFFRDPPVWKYLREEIVPQLESFPRINVWQVGCGRGEETYSLAIVLEEAGLARKTRLVATDINGDLLACARQGRWSGQDLARWRQAYLDGGGKGEFYAYFKQAGEGLVVRDHIRSRIEFVQHNLVADDVFMEAQFIVCRNVMIYFGETLQERGLDLFRRSLQRGGYLLLGKAESLLEVKGKLSSFHATHDVFRVYQKTVRSAPCHA
jgi:chemotaxis protein methyltransferase CheR